MCGGCRVQGHEHRGVWVLGDMSLRSREGSTVGARDMMGAGHSG